jgi:hypothetical protein
MSLPPAVPGLLAAFALLFAGDSLANDPQPSVSEGAAASDSAEPAQPAESEQEATEAETEAVADEAEEGVPPAEISLEEAAAQAQNVQIEGKPFDPAKASRKELDAYNADREPDQRIKCVQSYPTGSRRPTKTCMTNAQGRQWHKSN